ncbi:hypothetical protein ACODM8_10135 [Vibrio ostreicida]|uniref:hypothetical protein n=1 Tax=Vibrio ostreicida TaxID=526588 RepID=UPI003B5BA2CE
MTQFDIRPARPNDFNFLFELKKYAEKSAIEAVFGWDDNQQKQWHLNEWQQGQPNVIEIDGTASGSFLLQDKGDYFYFGRFFYFHTAKVSASLAKYSTTASRSPEIKTNRSG